MPSPLDLPEDDAIHVWRVELDGGGRAVARAALDDLLAAYLETAEPPTLAADPDGKPRLADEPGRLAFNLSHSGDLALVAVTAGTVEVGVDIEQVKPRRDLVRLAARWLPGDAETIATAGAEVREELFYVAWTRHEARVKCTGVGLGGPPPGPEVMAWALEIDPGYAAAVALSGAAGPRAAPRVLLRDASCRG